MVIINKETKKRFWVIRAKMLRKKKYSSSRFYFVYDRYNDTLTLHDGYIPSDRSDVVCVMKGDEPEVDQYAYERLKYIAQQRKAYFATVVKYAQATNTKPIKKITWRQYVKKRLREKRIQEARQLKKKLAEPPPKEPLRRAYL